MSAKKSKTEKQSERIMLGFTISEQKKLEEHRSKLEKTTGVPVTLAGAARALVLAGLSK